MTLTAPPAAERRATPEPTGRRWSPAAALAVVSYLLLALWVMSGLWASPAGRVAANNPGDHSLFLFVLAHSERVVYDGASLFHSDRMNVPVGVNMMANTSVLALALPLAPVTHAFGPGVTMALLLTLGLAGTAAAWYWFLRRRLELSPAAAWIGGLWGGFAPGWLSHASGHANFVCGFVLPFILDQVLRLRLPGRVWRGGIALGLLVVLQSFINEETLLIAAIALGVFAIAYTAMDFRAVREYALRFVAGSAVAAGVAGVLLAFPLYYQFLGPGHYHGQPFVLDRFATSLGSIGALPRESLFGSAAVAQRFSLNPTEDTVFWGPGACLMLIVAVVLLWRSIAARAAAISALVLLAMSFGSHFRLYGTPGGATSPLAWTMHVPLLDLVTTPRYALAPTAIVGILLAMAADRALRREGRRITVRRVLFAGGLVVALVPLFPRPVPTAPMAPAPAFFSQAMWRPYLHGTGRSILIVPLPNRTYGLTAERLGALSNSAFPMVYGFFMGPKDPPRDTTGAWKPPPRYTSDLLNAVSTGRPAPKRITPAERAQIIADLRYWNAAIVVLLPQAPHEPAINRLLTTALGTPATQGGVTVWDTRPLLAA